jgi:hypothetical protein
LSLIKSAFLYFTYIPVAKTAGIFICSGKALPLLLFSSRHTLYPASGRHAAAVGAKGNDLGFLYSSFHII